jgi:sialate O-acetylesterase
MYRRTFILAALVAVLCAGAQADLWMPSIFSSNMVLQQQQINPVWGKADPGATLSITFSTEVKEVPVTEEQTVTVGADGTWKAALKSKRADGKVYNLRVTHGAESLYFENIAIGEVWVCSGQSNMQWTVKDSLNADAELAAANYPNLRLFYVKRVTAETPQEDCATDHQWLAATPETVPGFSAVAYFFGRDLHTALNVPVGLIHTSWGGTPSESWTSAEAAAAEPAFAPITERWNQVVADYPAAKAAYDTALAEWQVKKDKGEATDENKPKAPMAPDSPHRISSLYNAMINPLIPYGIKGAIWYQGESNAGRAFQYRTIFPAMIKNWRTDWAQGDFPFYFVQLANFMDRKPEPVADDTWAELREAQTMTLGLPNTGMASAIDIGEAKDIHPKNKQEVGHRLALWALKNDYKKRSTVPSGPLYRSHEIGKDGKVTISFEYARDLQFHGEPVGFMIAGEDKQFVWAQAEIKGGKVVVWADAVPAPKSVRYAWQANPAVSLYNGAGLPASPFRTDDWPGMTVNEK